MTKEEFIEKLHSLLPAPDDRATASWADWTSDLGGGKETEAYLQDLYTAFCDVHQKYGDELAQSIYANMPYYVLMYPHELMPAAECLRGGYTFERIGEMAENDELCDRPIARRRFRRTGGGPRPEALAWRITR